ncbi:GNAT family N-acetyltransferase [Methylobacterium sp. EM32]|uniref:GNAT family N-acetyltransferase n=1 Tax=Methylobacterium sp. EM32 TaxID=3163481 RepID=UPI0033BD3402
MPHFTTECAASADLKIAPLVTLGPLAEPLRAEAEMRRVDFVRRLFEDHAAGANRFDRPGERLLGAWHGGHLVGVGGLNRDPYVADDGIGRLRHVYVLASHRRRGIGAVLVRALLREAEGHFRVVRLRAASAEAAAFYRRLGFQEAAEPNATHLIPVTPLR